METTAKQSAMRDARITLRRNTPWEFCRPNLCELTPYERGQPEECALDKKSLRFLGATRHSTKSERKYIPQRSHCCGGCRSNGLGIGNHDRLLREHSVAPALVARYEVSAIHHDGMFTYRNTIPVARAGFFITYQAHALQAQLAKKPRATQPVRAEDSPHLYQRWEGDLDHNDNGKVGRGHSRNQCTGTSVRMARQ